MNIYQSIQKVMEEIEPISKDRKNDLQNYKFRGIDDVYNALNPILSRYGVFFCPVVLSEKREERTSTKGGLLLYTILNVEFTVYASDGTNVRLVTIGEAMDSGDKGSNKAMSAAYKYAMMQLFCIPTEDEKDTETQTHEVAPKASQTTPNASGSSQKQNTKNCAVCNKTFAVDAKFPNAMNCSGVCGNKYKAGERFVPPSTPQEATETIPLEEIPF
jgi:hypothetical protein